jgi:hypothetical protein
VQSVDDIYIARFELLSLSLDQVSVEGSVGRFSEEIFEGIFVAEGWADRGGDISVALDAADIWSALSPPWSRPSAGSGLQGVCWESFFGDDKDTLFGWGDSACDSAEPSDGVAVSSPDIGERSIGFSEHNADGISPGPQVHKPSGNIASRGIVWSQRSDDGVSLEWRTDRRRWLCAGEKRKLKAMVKRRRERMDEAITRE